MSNAEPFIPAPIVSPPLGQYEVSGVPPTSPDTQQSATAEMMTRVVRGAHEAIDQIAERATPSLEKLEHGMTQTGKVLKDKAGQWHSTGDEFAESLRDSVREHPLVSVAAALAVGVVISRLAR